MFAKLLQFRVSGHARNQRLAGMRQPCYDNHPTLRVVQVSAAAEQAGSRLPLA